MEDPAPVQSDRLAEFATCFGAFEAEFSFTYNALRRHGIAEADAEDLVQEVFLVMWRRWAQYDRTRPIRPWLAGIAFRVAYNHRQRLGREVPGGLIDREDETPDPEERLAADTARLLVRRVLASLPEKHRSLILAHDVDGTTVREIAERLAVPIPTAHTRLRAARRAFAKTWKRLIAVSATRAQIAPLLAAGAGTAAEDTSNEVSRDPALARARRRSIERARALLPLGLLRAPEIGLVPRLGTSGTSSEATLSDGLPDALGRQRLPALWKAWLPVAGSMALGGAALLSTVLSSRAPAPLPAVDSVALAKAAAAPAERSPHPRSPVTFTSTAATPPSLHATALGHAEEGFNPTRGLSQGLIGYWRFDDGVGSPAARDFSGNGNDCQLRHLDAATAWSDGHLGGGLNFAADGWLECPKVEALTHLDARMTLALWVRRTGDKQSVRALVTRQFGDGDLDTFHLGFRNDELGLRSRVKGGPVFAGFPARRGQWHHVAATLDNDGMARLYVDGELVRKKPKEGRPSLGGGSNPLIIGGGLNGPDPTDVRELFQGSIDELCVYDRALHPEEIRALAQGAQPPLSR